MLTDKPSLLPTALYGILTCICLTIWHYVRSPLWIGGLAFLCIFWFAFLAASSWVAWLSATLSQCLPSVAKAYAEAKMHEARAREINALANADNDARRIYLEEHPAPAEATPQEPTNAKYIMLDNGTAIDREAMIEIANNAHGDELKPEHDVTKNQKPIRYAMTALAADGAIRKGTGSAGPVKIDPEKFHRYEMIARGYGFSPQEAAL